MRLAFDGKPFSGWQVQPTDRTVQGDLDDALSKLLGQPITSMGAGRTDTGVHAKEMFVHFDFDPTLVRQEHLLDPAELAFRLNRFLDPAIHVYEADEVDNQWHARFSATSRSYEYLLCADGNPFYRDRAWMVGQMPDLEKMNEAAAKMHAYEDFASFCKAGSDNKTTLCRIDHAAWEMKDGIAVFTITADRFLRNMVRATVGSLYEVGRGKWSVDEFVQRIEQKNRGAMGTSAPAHGLYLTRITY